MSMHAEDYKALGGKVIDWMKANPTACMVLAGLLIGLYVGARLFR